MITMADVIEALEQGLDDYYSTHPNDVLLETWLEGKVMAKATKLGYTEYKTLEAKLVPGTFNETREGTLDGLAYRKIIVIFLGERELRFVGPWKHEYVPSEGDGGKELLA